MIKLYIHYISIFDSLIKILTYLCTLCINDNIYIKNIFEYLVRIY